MVLLYLVLLYNVIPFWVRMEPVTARGWALLRRRAVAAEPSGPALEAEKLSAGRRLSTPTGTRHPGCSGRKHRPGIFQAAILKNAVDENAIIKNDVLVFEGLVLVSVHGFARL
jgi:hypothetical protein